jgi:hypothetical protein
MTDTPAIPLQRNREAIGYNLRNVRQLDAADGVMLRIGDLQHDIVALALAIDDSFFAAQLSFGKDHVPLDADLVAIRPHNDGAIRRLRLERRLPTRKSASRSERLPHAAPVPSGIQIREK